jgi:polyketide cyclase/dehydrase/lipid transport protein
MAKDDSDDKGGGGGGGGGDDGVGKGRRMPVQQAIDVGVPVKTAYNQFTQFEEWPKFMHRVTSVSQEDETHVSFKSKIWGVSKEFQAEIDEQRPDERIKWHVTQGLSHKGVATFHELAPRLTRIEVSVDVEPGSLIEKFARGARHVKRAMRADLHRYKAYIMMNEHESGEWRGTIEDAEVKSSEKSASSGGGRRSKSGEAKAASSSSGRSRSSSKNGSSERAAKRSSSSNGGDPSPTSSRRRKSGSRS